MNEKWMSLALQEAKKGEGRVSPNPCVGAVIVHEGELMAKGFHEQNGGAHAEANAIAKALETHPPERLRESTIYVTLEPCSTRGRTGACTDRIIQAGFKKVIFGSVDPNPDHEGRAVEVLQAQGVEVVSRVLEEECDHLIRGFIQVQKNKRPWVAVKVGQSLDGRLNRPEGENQWLTSTQSKQKVQELRREFDAVVTSSVTAKIDNPSLTRRNEADEPLALKLQNQRFVLSRSPDQLPKGLKLFTDGFAENAHVIDSADLKEAFRQMAEMGCNSVMIEAGGGLISALIEAELVDEWIAFLAPMISGGDTFTTRTPALNETYFKCIHHEVLGGDVYTRSIKAESFQKNFR